MSGRQHRLTANNRQSKPSTKSQRLDAMARKKDERAARKKASKASTNSDVSSPDDKNFSQQLAAISLQVRQVIGDGNCLFRALADQLDGDDKAHARHRQDVVRYITEHRHDFEPFIEDDVPFNEHVHNLAIDGTYGGNDSIVAFARLHKLTVVIHQLDSPAWEVHGENSEAGTCAKVQQLHISYHNGEHYASVRRLNDTSDSPANVHLSTPSAGSGEANSGTGKTPSGIHSATTGLYEDLSFIERVMEVTRCKDRRLVSEISAEAGYFDLDLVCGHVLAFMDGLSSSPSSSSATSDGELTTDGGVGGARGGATPSAGAKPKSCNQQQQQQRGGTRPRRYRKQEKKARAAQRHQAAAAAAAGSSSGAVNRSGSSGVGGVAANRVASSDEDDTSVAAGAAISQQLKVLQI